jgi:hypothetical protein
LEHKGQKNTPKKEEEEEEEKGSKSFLFTTLKSLEKRKQALKINYPSKSNPNPNPNFDK